MSKFKVLMTDNVLKNLSIETKILEEIDAELIEASNTSAETFIKEGKNCDAFLNVYAEIPESVIEKLEKCRAIVRMGIGFNTIDIEAAAKKGIMVANVPDYCLDEVADHAMTLMLSLIRKACYMNNKVKSGVWNAYSAKPIPRLQNLTLGLVGFGNIAQKVAKRAQAFGMKVIAYDPYLPDSVFENLGVEGFNSFDEFVIKPDVFSLHAPLTTDTNHIINKDSLAKMKPACYIVNTSRGQLINENDLLEVLKNGHLAGAALDVLEVEPPIFPCALAELDNVILTPHAAFYSEESTPDLRTKAAQEVVRVLTEGKPKNWVNKNMF